MPSKARKTTYRSNDAVPAAAAASAQSAAKQQLPIRQHVETDVSESPLDQTTGDTTESAEEQQVHPAGVVNRKKQKRRQKEASRRIEAQTAEANRLHQKFMNGQMSMMPPFPNGQINAVKQGRGPVKGYFTEETEYVNEDYQDQYVNGEQAYYSEGSDIEYDQQYEPPPDRSWLNTSRRKRSSQKARSVQSQSASTTRALPKSTFSANALRSAHQMANSKDKDQIWDSSNQAERENIKQFWLELGEDERRSLVRVEKEAVLRKMKEQQKSSCSCSVCGRKRTAIEEELEVLYDAYYQELEQFANHDRNGYDSPTQVPSPARRPYQNQTHHMAGAYPVQGRVHELDEDGEELEDDQEYGDDEDEEGDEEEEQDEDELGSDEDYDDELPPAPTDFFQFGASLTVKDGILTVADDLLKNDGKHFIDMMEQLAERRMQREEDIRPSAGHHYRDGQPPLDEDDDYDDEEEDEDYDSQDDEDDLREDEMDSMTEEQRMEEGRRMFQIFAARMFEQRVLTAYKEKVAIERQKKLLEELEEESKLDGEREAKKAESAARKKEKKDRQKQAKAEEKAAKNAEKAAAEAAAAAEEERKAAEKKAKQEEQRKKREADRKAAEEERLRKEAEKVVRQQKEKERQAEAERKAKEAKERERKAKEEQRRKEREEKEAREAEAREKKLAEEKERRERELEARKEKEAAQKVERDARDKAKADAVAAAARSHQTVALPPGLNPVQMSNSAHMSSPGPVSLNVDKKRPVSQSFQQSQTSSPNSQQASTEVSRASGSPVTATSGRNSSLPFPAKHPRQPPYLQSNGVQPSVNAAGRNNPYPYPQNGLHGMGINGGPHFQNHMGPMGPPMQHMYQQHHINNQRQHLNSNMNYGPNFRMQPSPSTYHMPFHQQLPPHLPHLSTPPSNHIETVVAAPKSAHSRQASGSENSPQSSTAIKPPPGIPNLGPIARPLSITPDRPHSQQSPKDKTVEDLTKQLSSSALLDGSDEPDTNGLETSRYQAPPIGPPSSTQAPFPSTFEKVGPSTKTGWPPFYGQSNLGNWNQPPADSLKLHAVSARPHVTRFQAVRLMVIQACRHLSQRPGAKPGDYFTVPEILPVVEQMKPSVGGPVRVSEMDEIWDTEGTPQNGGGMFELLMDSNRGQMVRFREDATSAQKSGVGDIGSPVVGPGHFHSQGFGSMRQNQHMHQQHGLGQGLIGGHFGPPGRGF